MPLRSGHPALVATTLVALSVVAGCSSDTAPVSATSASAATGPAATGPAATDAPSTLPTDESDATTVDTIPVTAAVVAQAGTYTVATVVDRVTDPARDRRIAYTVYAPVGVTGPVPVILVSHGGEGNPRGHLSAPHLGSTFASGGFIAIHLAHDRPADGAMAIDDRPADVTFVLDELAAGRITLPGEFGGSPDLDRVGHTGHSFGAYTSHAVAGATYLRTYRDERIDAIAPISPQGPDQFGAFVDGPGDTTWTTVTIPAFNLIGGDEIDSNAVDSIVRPGWRLAPFDNYPGTSDTFRTIIDGQNHSEMWRTGSDEVQRFIAEEILDFMRLYVAGDLTVDACGIGVGELTYASIERHPAAAGTHLSSCG